MDALPGVILPKVDSAYKNAWAGGFYQTVRITEDVEAVRVHRGSGSFQIVGGRAKGVWFAVGDVILRRSEYTASRALPAAFSRVDWCMLKAGTVVNFGIASPLFGHSGGGEQVEWLSGPEPDSSTTIGNWADVEGNT